MDIKPSNPSTRNPYTNLPGSAFWRTGVVQENPYAVAGLYRKKFTISPYIKIATAGSCFAQHISRHLQINGYNVLDVEPAPPGLSKSLHRRFGFSMYSARYGNIYSVLQLLQLAQEAAGERTPNPIAWQKDGRYVDALRPAVEPEGLASPEEVLEHRKYHISRVKKLLKELDLFIFTLGLTEMWLHQESGTVYPTAPGSIAGTFDDKIYSFKNASFNEIIRDFNAFQAILTKLRAGRPFKLLLTVSPVPLTATASGHHVLAATSYSKSTLRAVAGQLADNQAHIDYFPSYEIVTNPRLHCVSFSDNLRSVRDEAVTMVMQHFFTEHPKRPGKPTPEAADHSQQDADDTQCEEALLEAFGR